MKKTKVKKNEVFTRVLTIYNFDEGYVMGNLRKCIKGEKLKEIIENHKKDAYTYSFSILDSFNNEVFDYRADSGITKNLLTF